MTNILAQFEKRISQLEEELRRMRAKLEKNEVPWWEKIAGRQEGDQAFREIARLGRQIRKAEGKNLTKDNGKGKRKVRASKGAR